MTSRLYPEQIENKLNLEVIFIFNITSTSYPESVESRYNLEARSRRDKEYRWAIDITSRLYRESMANKFNLEVIYLEPRSRMDMTSRPDRASM